MKKLALLLPCLLVFFGARAQFGIKGGINQAVINGTVGEDASYKTSYHAGILYEIKLIGPLSVQPEVLYSLQGTERKSDFVDYRTKLHYLTVPVLAKATIGPVFVEAGPQFGYLVSARDNGTIQVSSTDNSSAQYTNVSNQNANDNYKRGDFSLCVGAGIKLGSIVSLGARFNAGLNDINDASGIRSFNDSKLKNRVFQGYLSFQLPTL